MCVVSMVHDHFLPQFEPYLPKPLIDAQPWPYQPTNVGTIDPDAYANLFAGLALSEVVTIREMIAQFREAKAAAERIDVLTKQPDCVDPEKAKLLARIDALEAALTKPKTRRKTARKVRRVTP